MRNKVIILRDELVDRKISQIGHHPELRVSSPVNLDNCEQEYRFRTSKHYFFILFKTKLLYVHEVVTRPKILNRTILSKWVHVT